MKTTPWSFSRLKLFQQCPKKFYHLKVLKDYVEPETDAMLYGTDFHEAAEKFVKGEADLPRKYDYARSTLLAIRSRPGDKLCEYQMGLTKDLSPCDFDASDVWVRGIVDLLIIEEDKSLAWISDYKTGQNTRYADPSQLELMALLTFKHFPDIKIIKASLLFIVAEQLITQTYKKELAPILWNKWLTDHSAIEQSHISGTWNPIQSGLCKKHCVVIECVHNGRR